MIHIRIESESESVSFGEAVSNVLREGGLRFALVCELDSCCELARIRDVLIRQGIAREQFASSSFPLFDSRLAGEVLFSDESVFPNASTVAFLNQPLDRYREAPYSLSASAAFGTAADPTGRTLNPDMLEDLMVENQFSCLVTWFEFVATIWHGRAGG